MLTSKTGAALIQGGSQPESETMVKVKITGNTVVQGQGAVMAGQVCEVDETTARTLMAVGRAIPAPEEPEKPTTRKPKTSTRTKKK